MITNTQASLRERVLAFATALDACLPSERPALSPVEASLLASFGRKDLVA